MDDKLMGRIECVCAQINSIFGHNERERINTLIGLAEIVFNAPDMTSLDVAIGAVEEALQAGVHNAKMEILGYMEGGKG